jgi:alkanesulfonate monooxygenase SsuD/methylene tetrahydromethanopterin reductase-like flavin-dependent oxidoreductase (luciferase family)
MTAAFTGTTVERPDGFFPAVGHSMLPRPVQRPRPPIWVGGNSEAAMRRAALKADGWLPFPQPEVMARITGSPPLTSLDELKVMIAKVRQLREEAGLDGPFDIAFASFGRPDPEGDPDGHGYREQVAEYADAGVTWLSLGARGRSLAACVDELAWLGEAIVAPLRRAEAAAG